MLILDAETVVVYNTDDLSDAVSTDNGYIYVYLGADIPLQYGISIFPGKPSLTIDGRYPDDDTGIIRTFTDMNSNTIGNTIAVRQTSSIHITIQNINLIGRNFYGIPCVYEGTGSRNVTLTYRNVTYQGSQPIYNPSGLTQIFDCDMRIVPLVPAAASPLQEIGEVSRLEIGGVTNLHKYDTDNAVFWFRGVSSSDSYLKILSGAQVTVNTANYFMYTQYPIPYTIEKGASFSLTTYQGICYDASHRVSSFLVEEGAGFYYIRTSNAGTPITLYMSGTLTVNRDASFYMQADYANTGALIRFASSSAGLQINNPRSFVIYSSNTTAFSFGATVPISLNGQQINDWRTTTPFPDAGGFGDIPLYKWCKEEYLTLSFTGTVSSGATNISYHNLTPEEQADLPPVGNFALHLLRVFSLGNLPLYPDTIINDGRPVTGQTAYDAMIIITYSESGFFHSFAGQADENGNFSIRTPSAIPFAELVTMVANLPFLLSTELIFSQEEGELRLEEVPDPIVFIPRPISESPVILPRKIPGAPVIVYDNRTVGTAWELLATVDTPLTAPDGQTLPDAVVFADENGILHILDSDPTVVYTASPKTLPEEITTITWDMDRGILGKITVPIAVKTEYTTILHWEVQAIDDPPPSRPE